MSSADRYWTGPFPARSAKQVAADAAYKQAMLFANTPAQRAKIKKDAATLFPWVGPKVQNGLDHCIGNRTGAGGM